ncbi:Autoinducer 2 sensor kinase/phosphatase LuxQ [Paraburkholderia sabiae]|nr:Autoinducer 2 sensor kinase/phosphatase LuxQ [Paraburkholderia sabiae]
MELLDRASDDGAFVRNGISVIRRSVITQRRLVDDLVDVTRIKRGKFTVTRSLIAVTDCFNAALQEIRPIAGEKGVFVADLVAEPVYVQGDGPRLQQVFGNLLNNALKHTEQGGKILPSLVETGNTVSIRIADTGAGIPPERLTEIFEPFVQVESTVNRERAGLGLGLAIARSIVLMHGGEITAQSAGPGQGASFTVVLPTVRSHPSDASAESPHADLESAIKGRTVLLVEDDEDTLQALALTLQFEDIQVLTATSAEEAHPLIERTLPDAIVSDLTMSGASGCELLQSIRARGITAPAIALSGHVRAEDEQMARAAGFDDYLAKPVDPAKLIDALARLIKQ